MNMKNDQIYFEINHLKYAEEALNGLCKSPTYQQYKRGLESVENLEQRYSLAYRYMEVLSTMYELELAIKESKMVIEETVE